MRRLSSLILALLLSLNLFAQKSPHGSDFVISCKDCHKTDSWKVDLKKVSFDHDGTKFPLVGQHQAINCKQCHTSLEFAKTQTECNSCHTDIHQQTVGPECARCHTPNSWVVTNITQLHQQSRFPLLGPHATADCYDCHTNVVPSAGTPPTPTASLLRFDPLGIECYDCHQANYANATSPNHVQGNYSKNCTECHSMNSFSWTGASINHSFFPLTEGHAINECNKCHTSGSYSNTSAECISCHQPDYSSTSNPNHASLNFSTNCKDCHTIAPGWKPAEYRDHDAKSFPIYSGKHNGQWNSCADCHTNAGNYAQFTCIACHDHNKVDTDSKHQEVSGYAYSNDACFACHPSGSSEGSFNHSSVGFPLTGGHSTTDCASCHAKGYSGTSNVCADCHTPNYNQTTNPNHSAISIANDCATCHTTNPGWNPATFPTHNNYYVLAGAHVPIANDCATCHNGNYTNSPKTCFGCHANNFNQTTNPNHITSQFSTTCETCHSQNDWIPSTFDHNNVYPLTGAHATIAGNCTQCHTNGYSNTPNTCAGCHTNDYNQTTNPNHTAAHFPTTCADCHTQINWTPATFNHDGQYFPIYSGKHNGQWNACADCHTNPSNFTIFTCTTSCHPQSSTNDSHQGVGGYQYNSDACLSCHPAGNSQGTFNHNTSPFPLIGGHASVDCASCHANGYIGTSNVCADCHTPNYNQTTNPNHTSIGISNDCATCHTTNPGWDPATFPTHNNYYVLAGAHVPIANDCATCHNGNYSNSPKTCFGCHAANFNQTSNPNHTAANFPTTCADCHTQSSWTPATFNHDGQYFPIYSGKHNGQWNTCADCHTNLSNFAIFTCTTSCHPQSSTNNSHQSVGGYQYNSDACFSCHPTGTTQGSFNHNTSPFPLTGGHAAVDCANCHTNGYNGTSNVCAGCHTSDYNQTANPNHKSIGISNDCATCHTTNPGWDPATFPTHNSYYVLAGAHISIANDCATCHQGNYVNSPKTCFGCHAANFNQTTNPNHVASQFSTTCETCHSQSAWIPSSFNHNITYPLTGAHAAIASNCTQCHTNGYANTPNTCAGCHQANFNQSANPNHNALGIPNDCSRCHTTNAGWAPATFPIHNNYYVLSGAHVITACADCHKGNYNSTPNTCAGCHTNDYNQTTNPNHTSAKFPTTCSDCHTQSKWSPSTFNHDAQYFPIYSGRHNGQWNTCADCHTNPSNFAVFSCTSSSCHPQSSTNSNHQGVNGYSYNSTACYNCHPHG